MGETVQDGQRVYSKHRTFWLKHLHRWHWISSAICLVGMLLFAVTGITLNHAADIEARPRVDERRATLPPDLLTLVATKPADGRNGPVPPAVAGWVVAEMGVRIEGRTAEWSDDEVYVALPRPGGDAWLSISIDDGEVVHERS